MQAADQRFRLLACRVLVCRAGAGDDRKLVSLHKVGDHLLGQIEHRADLGHAAAVEVGDRFEAADAALIEQRHQEGFDRVVAVVPQGNLADPHLRDRIGKRPAPHLRAERTGIFLFAALKGHGTDLRLDAVVRYLQTVAERRDRREVHAGKTHVDREGLQGIGTGIEFPHLGKQNQQRKRVLAA